MTREPCPMCHGKGDIEVWCPTCENTGQVEVFFGTTVIQIIDCPRGCRDD